jgi:hypothetical protein
MPLIFERVKEDVRRVKKKRRAGLRLGLVEWGMSEKGFIGGMHLYPGTEIIMNKTPLIKLLEKQPYEIVWAYTYHILLHEYIHSLGFLNEWQCREIALEVSKAIFSEEDHPAIQLAKKGIGAFFPNLKLIYAPPGYQPDGRIPKEYISDFDRESFEYYS